MRGRIITGFGLLVLILIGVAAGSAWQVRTHQAYINDLESHSRTATLLQEAEAQAGIAALSLQRYVIAENAALPPGVQLASEVKSNAAASVDALTKAAAQQGAVDLTDIAVTGASLSRGASEVIALRQAGDAEGSAAAIEELVPVFYQFRLQLEDATALEIQEVANLRSQADRAGKLALWLLIISGAAGAFIGLVASILIARSIISPLSSLEETAVAVSEGDLSARAPATGPRELAHLGAVLNHMMSRVETHTAELERANRELEERHLQLTDARMQAATDPLTGLGNHRAFHKRIRDEVAGAEDTGVGVGLILFDIDNFKGFNDSLGHLAGDEILRSLATALHRAIKREDAYRYGGDEFAVLMPSADLKGSVRAAERLRLAVEKMSTGDGQKLTVSLGVASFPDMAASAEELIYRADMAMYWAKSTGKNRVGDWDGLLSRRTDGSVPLDLGNRDGKVRDAVVSLVSALAAKDPVTRDHTERCSWYTAELAAELGLDEEEASVVRLASLLHDIGKLVVPVEVLCKPGPLTEEEWVQMRQHPTTALHILSPIDSTSNAVPAILHHHEHFDGSGYPGGLAGDDIPMASRILLVADAFDAMTTDRPYRKAMPIKDAIEELRRHRGSQFDPEVVDAFLKILDRGGAHPLHGVAVADESS
ncbi:MAG TPA: HD domain-containing phosphohydrolase [Dehalococcoidia bacterium]|nr:HD domain-containing phosphohydrolase [Dehalococcoidia bacterium]